MFYSEKKYASIQVALQSVFDLLSHIYKVVKGIMVIIIEILPSHTIYFIFVD